MNFSLQQRVNLIEQCILSVTSNSDYWSYSKMIEVQVKLSIKIRLEITPEVPISAWLQPSRHTYESRYTRWLLESIYMSRGGDEHILSLFKIMKNLLPPQDFTIFAILTCGMAFQNMQSSESFNVILNSVSKALKRQMDFVFERPDYFFNCRTLGTIDFKKVLTLYFNNFNKNHMKTLIVRKFPASKLNILRCIVKDMDYKTLDHFFTMLVETFDINEVENILIDLDLDLIELALLHYDREKFQILLNFMRLLSKSFFSGQLKFSRFHFSIIHKDGSAMRLLIKAIEETLTKTEIRSLLFFVGMKGKTCFHYAASSVDLARFRAVWKTARKFLDEADFISLLRMRDLNGRSVLVAKIILVFYIF